MAMSMPHAVLLSIFVVIYFGVNSSCQQLQYSQTEVLQQLRKQLEFPKQLDPWNSSTDPCFLSPSPSLTLTCEGASVTELRIIGDRASRLSSTRRFFIGYALPNETLSRDFSVDSFVTTLARLSSLRVVVLVSLGIWGPLPQKIGRLYALEALDLSSNYLFGEIPQKISAIGMLQNLSLDGNFFNGSVPEWLGSLSNLRSLSFKDNKLKGTLPGSVGTIRALNSLSLSGNNVSGKVPDLSGLTSLQVLDLVGNGFDSELPVLPAGVVTVLLSRNLFTGGVPVQYGNLSKLQHLDLSFNLLQGCPPPGLFSLPNISYINLASNMLSGTLPKGFTCSKQLGFVDVSTNRLTGDLPTCLRSISSKIVVNASWNCLSNDTKHQHEAAFCQEGPKNNVDPKSRNIWLLVGIIVGGTIVILLFLVAVLMFCRRYYRKVLARNRSVRKAESVHSPTCLASELLANARLISQKQKLGTQVLPACRTFSLEELQEATNNFDISVYIGEGSMGKIYKGRLENGRLVAIKCLSIFKRDSVRNLKLRLDLLSKLRHPHLVCLLGHCIESASHDSNVSRVFLVYEYLPNGNLRDLLAENRLERALKWQERLNALIGIAKAVHFLHTGVIPGFFNNRLKTSNILLDEHYVAKVSDYGLSLITEDVDRHEKSMEGLKSSQAVKLMNPWDLSNLEDDVYLFGFIILETLVGPSVIEKGEAYVLTRMAASSSDQEELKQILDSIVFSTSTHESLSIVVSIANKCVSPDPSFRPSFEDILWNLQYAAQVHGTDDGDQRSDITS